MWCRQVRHIRCCGFIKGAQEPAGNTPSDQRWNQLNTKALGYNSEYKVNTHTVHIDINVSINQSVNQGDLRRSLLWRRSTNDLCGYHILKEMEHNFSLGVGYTWQLLSKEDCSGRRRRSVQGRQLTNMTSIRCPRSTSTVILHADSMCP